MSNAKDVGAKWCDHCHKRFDDSDEVDAVRGLFFHPDCPHEIPATRTTEEREKTDENQGRTVSRIKLEAP